METDWMPCKKRPRRPRKIETEWTPSDVKMLIQLVEQRELLWDPTEASHKDGKMRERAFHIIAEALDRSIADCKAKWDNLRAQFRSYQAKASQNISVKWQYFESLRFLNRVCEARKSKNNSLNFDSGISNDPMSINDIKIPFSPNQNQYAEDTNTCSNFFASSRRKTANNVEEDLRIEDTMMVKAKAAQEQNYNSAQIFGDFVADQMRQLRPHVSDELKKNILKLVLDALEKNTVA